MGVAKGAAASWGDGDLDNGVGVFQEPTDNRMARLMVSDHVALNFAQLF